MYDKLNEYCGFFGIFNHKDAAVLTQLGLHSLQHRGQEGAGIVSCDKEKFTWIKSHYLEFASDCYADTKNCFQNSFLLRWG